MLRQQLSSDPSLLTPSLLQSLSPILFTLPTTDDAQDILSAKMDEIVGTMYPSWMTECANLLWFLLDLDSENKSGIKDQKALGAIQGEWLEPMRKRVEELKIEMGGKEVEVKFIVERWHDAVLRASEAVGKALA
jgi:hypothetical protein